MRRHSILALAAAALAISGGARTVGAPTVSGSSAIYDTHAHLFRGAAVTGSMSWRISQEGFYAPGDGGSAVYEWNPTSYCPGGTSAVPMGNDNLICVLPSGQKAHTPGRYLLQLAAGAIDARQLGFRDDGTDNAPLVAGMNTALSMTGAHVVFSSSSVNRQANYWFSQPLDVAFDGGISCGDGSIAPFWHPGVNLVFEPGVDGVRFINAQISAMEGYPPAGVFRGNLKGCGIISTGYSVNYTPTIAGNPTVAIPRTTTPDQIIIGAQQPEPIVAIGDSLAMFPLNTPYQYFTGSINGNVLTVTSTPIGSQSATDPGIAIGQMLQGPSNMPHGIFIAATNAENPAYSGTGGAGTYLLSFDIGNPPVAGEAVAGGAIASQGFRTEVQSGLTTDPPGTTVTACTTNAANQCPQGGTMTLSNPPNLGTNWAYYLLPGPNSAKGSQMYNVTTSLTGHTSSAFQAGISNGGGAAGNTLNVTGGSPSLDLGQVVIGTAGGIVSASLSAPLSLGQYNNIQVSSCTGLVPGAFVVGLDGVNSIFPPGAIVDSCVPGTPNLLAVDTVLVAPGSALGNHTTSVTAAGSPVIQIRAYYVGLNALWVGEPITGTNIPPNTTIKSWSLVPYDNSEIQLTLSQAATADTPVDRGDAYVGGAIDAAPSGTSLTFMQGSATIVGLGTGTGGNGTYTLDSNANLAAGSTVYAYDTPGTVYLTGGPRNILPQDPIWSDAFPFGSIAAEIYGTSAKRETVIVAPTSPYGQLSATVAHASGSGKLWVIPSAIMRNTRGSSSGNEVVGWGIGVNMACAQNEYPETGCGLSVDTQDDFFDNMIGRLTAGNNSGGSLSQSNEYDKNLVADIAEIGTVGSTYIGEMLQGADESVNTRVFISGCGTNGSPVIGAYASGSEWSATCLPYNVGMFSALPFASPGLGGGPWVGATYQNPYTPPVGASGYQPLVNCSGAPTSSFKVDGAVVTHC